MAVTLQWLAAMTRTPGRVADAGTGAPSSMCCLRMTRLCVCPFLRARPAQVWTQLPTEQVLAQAAAATVAAPLQRDSPACAAVLAEGLDPQLVYDYRCRVLHMAKAHYGECGDCCSLWCWCLQAACILFGPAMHCRCRLLSDKSAPAPLPAACTNVPPPPRPACCRPSQGESHVGDLLSTMQVRNAVAAAYHTGCDARL